MAYYTRDPRWITSKFSGVDINGLPYHKGQRVLFYPVGSRVITGAAADQAWRQFAAEVLDEQVFGG